MLKKSYHRWKLVSHPLDAIIFGLYDGIVAKHEQPALVFIAVVVSLVLFTSVPACRPKYVIADVWISNFRTAFIRCLQTFYKERS